MAVYLCTLLFVSFQIGSSGLKLCCCLQALQYLLKLCSHPLLVLGEKIPESVACLLSEQPASSDIISELQRPCHSPKLVALQEILEECGIGVDASNSEAAVGVGQHRVLIFAQHKVILTHFHYFLKLFFGFLNYLSYNCGILSRPFWT